MNWLFILLALVTLFTPIGIYLRLKRLATDVAKGYEQLDQLVKERDELAQKKPSEEIEDELQALTNRIAFLTHSFNDLVELYNLAQKQFLAPLFAASFGHKKQEFFKEQSFTH